eukprot:6458663-Amphidinium_carterae.1
MVKVPRSFPRSTRHVVDEPFSLQNCKNNSVLFSGKPRARLCYSCSILRSRPAIAGAPVMGLCSDRCMRSHCRRCSLIQTSAKKTS